MRKSRGKYKVLSRLGYNAIMRVWTGNKKKWEKHVIYGKSEKSHERNPIVALKNQEIITFVKKKGKVRRRKDIHGIRLSQKTGRKRMYGGVTDESIQKGREKERKQYKQRKREEDRCYRKGVLAGERERLTSDLAEDKKVEERKRKKQKRHAHRISNTERRADVRRWRSGRIPTLQIARDVIEHEYVNRVDSEGNTQEVVKWQGTKVRVGSGRKVNEKVWENIKGRSTDLINKKEYKIVAASYMEVDYITGRRIVVRKPDSGEVIIPKGINVSIWTYL